MAEAWAQHQAAHALCFHLTAQVGTGKGMSCHELMSCDLLLCCSEGEWIHPDHLEWMTLRDQWYVLSV